LALPLKPTTVRHLKKVYTNLAGMLAVSSLGVLAHSSNFPLEGGLVSVVAATASLLAFYFTQRCRFLI
jgi:lysozyme family protein